MLFTVSILLASTRHFSSGDSQESLWEERFVVVDAIDEDEAKMLAMEIGILAEHDFEAADGSHVYWQFKQVAGTYMMDILSSELSGVEVFSRFLHPTQVKCLIEKVKE